MSFLCFFYCDLFKIAAPLSFGFSPISPFPSYTIPEKTTSVSQQPTSFHLTSWSLHLVFLPMGGEFLWKQSLRRLVVSEFPLFPVLCGFVGLTVVCWSSDLSSHAVTSMWCCSVSHWTTQQDCRGSQRRWKVAALGEQNRKYFREYENELGLCRGNADLRTRVGAVLWDVNSNTYLTAELEGLNLNRDPITLGVT